MGLLTRSTGIARSASIFRTRPVSREVRNYVRRVRKILADLAIPVDLVNKPIHGYLDRGTLRVGRKIRAIQRTEARRSSRELGLEASLGRFEERPLRGANLANTTQVASPRRPATVCTHVSPSRGGRAL